MTTEEKARAYDEAIERAKELMNKGYYVLMPEIFPELKESEDERIRKWLIDTIKAVPDDSIEWEKIDKSNVISWLEKQGEQKSVDDLTQQEAMDIAVAKCFEQNEQNPVDNIEPKFHKGEWITSEESVWQVDEVKTENYLLIDSEGILFAEEIATIDSEFHLWTIQDAKDGDVLARNSDILSICIFGHFDGISNKFSSFLCHCGLEGDGLAQELSINGYYDDSQDYVPATKEQRDLLFAKMKEAGYKWDVDKKEIRKIDQNIGWGEEDEKMVKDIIAAIDTLYYYAIVNCPKHLKYRVQPQNIWHDASEKLPTGVIIVNCGGNLYIGWSTNEGDGIEDEHGRLITKTYQKWAREKDLI